MRNSPFLAGFQTTYCPNTELRALIPARKIVVHSRKETSFCKAEEPTRRHQSRPVENKTHEGHGNAPSNPKRSATWDDQWGHSTYMMMGMKIEGRRRFNNMFVKGSNSEYETKKMDRAALYCPVDRLPKLF